MTNKSEFSYLKKRTLEIIPQRKIIHIDMDAFFASVEQRDNPDLRGKPVAVGGSRERGVVAAASYEARKYGVRSAMASKTALRLCPQLVFAPHRFDVYKEVSTQIREIFFEYTDLVEPLSLDEAFLDVTENNFGNPSATLIAKEIKRKIKEKTQLTASAGVSFNKFLAKVASDMDKPDGIFVIKPEQADAFLEKLPIEKFFGIGKVTAGKMKDQGIFKGADLKKKSEIDLIRLFGKAGRYYYRIVRADDRREVKPNRIRKSFGAERTFEEDIEDFEQVRERAVGIAKMVFERLKKSKATGKTVTLKLKSFDFEQKTRSKTLKHGVSSERELVKTVEELLEQPNVPEKALRLIGVAVSNLDERADGLPIQLEIDFGDSFR
ncbi:DNA polymerase IV [Flammeovirgaceae bacterium SG7u.111]|nr:DNA polymerase IV [Flammeovirgaceae bacterium SG7u.132]WPO33334.1 DNA polymerase IV [Flammeovirgaceae bacterium SG7u.111]